MDQDEYEHFPLRRFLGMDIEDVEPGHAIARLEVNEDLLNPNGTVHGGVLFTMVDTAMGKATMTSLGEGQRCASIEIQIRFLRPVRSGRLVADTTVIKRGRKIVHLESRIHDADGMTVATGAGTFAVIAASPTPV
jgi:acyl-CoA thioesterase